MMAGLSDVFGGKSAVTQLFIWQVMAQIIGAVLEPTLTLVSQQINADNPVVDLSPADLANLVVRNYRDMSSAAGEAARSGINADRFADMVHLAGDAPGPSDLAIALRRGIIPEYGTGPDAVTFEAGLREGRLADKWQSMVKDLATQWPTPADALDALLEGQLSYDDALALYKRVGGDPQFFTILFNTRGNAPTPVEALELANRGIIPWDGEGPDITSYHQAFLEGPWRNKWEKPFRALGEYLPPPRTVTAMVSAGSLTPERGTELLLKQGLAPDLAAAYIHDALDSQNKADRELTVGQLMDMYTAGVVSASLITPLLKALGYSDTSIAWLFAYRDIRKSLTRVNAALSKVRTLYVTHKVTRDVAERALNALGVPAAEIADVVGTWTIERDTNVAVLTAAQIADAWKYGIINEGEALTELQSIGYTPRDAWVFLSIKNKAPLDNKPEQGPAPTSPQPSPGVTA